MEEIDVARQCQQTVTFERTKPMKRTPAPLPPAALVRGKAAAQAVKILERQIERHELRSLDEPDPKRRKPTVDHLQALLAELERQKQRLAAMN
jgi:hypothetical protein